jgi:pyruvate/2-oxoglutarate dehydrogenase complex dihydrolipoamide acyltransferase (E2) component
MSTLHEIRLPDLGMPGQDVRLSVWLVEQGENVLAGDRLVEILAGPATVDLASPADGVLKEILAEEDEPLKEGQLLGVVEEIGEA